MLGQLKPNWSPGFSLTHRRSANCITIGSDIIDRNCDYIAAPQFTVDGKIEHRQVTFTPLNLEHGAYLPRRASAAAAAWLQLICPCSRGLG
jgi:hypothetical protein